MSFTLSHIRSLQLCSQSFSSTNPYSSTRSSLKTKMSFSTESTAEVLFQREPNSAVAVAVLNRPKALNSLNLNMIRLLTQKYKEWDADPTIKLIVMKGAGDKAFCAGGDVVAVYKDRIAEREGKSNGSEWKAFFYEEYQLDFLIASLKTPHLAFLNGITMGGGVGLSVNGKFRIATPKTLFAMPETAIGFLPDVGGSYFLPRLPGKLGLYYGLTGQRISGPDLLNVGIATHYITDDRVSSFEQTIQSLSAQECEPNNLKELLNSYSIKKQQIDTSLVDSVFGAGSIEKIIERLEKDDSEWSKKTLSQLSSAAPTSLKVVHKQIRMGAQLNLAQCFGMEWSLVHGFLRRNDFLEGVRSLLVDKDKKYNWTPKTLSEVTDQIVDSHWVTDIPQLPLPQPADWFHYVHPSKL